MSLFDIFIVKHISAYLAVIKCIEMAAEIAAVLLKFTFALQHSNFILQFKKLYMLFCLTTVHTVQKSIHSIHALNEIQTRDPSVRKCEDIS
jgi:hypothetical protein